MAITFSIKIHEVTTVMPHTPGTELQLRTSLLGAHFRGSVGDSRHTWKGTGALHAQQIHGSQLDKRPTTLLENYPMAGLVWLSG